MKLTVLIFSLMTLASNHTGLPVPEREPIVKKVSQEQLWYMLYNQEYDPESTHQLFGAHKNGIIYLTHKFNPKELRDTGILLHELVHYMQQRSEKSYACTGNREHEAYEVQFDYYRAAGVKDPLEYFNMNMLFYRLKTACHPALQVPR